MFDIRANLPSRSGILHLALLLVAFAIFSACSATTDEGECTYNEDTQKCE